MTRRSVPDLGSLDHAVGLARSIARDPLQSAGVLVGLAGLATLHPFAALASGVAGIAFAAVRPKRPRRDLFGRTSEDVAELEAGFNLPLGRQVSSGRPIVIGDDDARQHLLVLGNTGSGKTEFLMALAESAVAQGSGLLFVDGKGDVSLFAKAWRMAQRHGRVDDLLVLNMMTGTREGDTSGETLLSNTMNPFATGSAISLTHLLVGMLDEVGGDGAVWRGRSVAMLTAAMMGLVDLREQGRIELDAGSVRNYLNLTALHGLRSAEGMSDESRAAIDAYLASLPGYNPERGARQSQTTLDHHGYMEMPFTRILGRFSEVYGHIFKTSMADIDMADVVLNRRILVVMLPALEKSGDEIADLGKVILATLKGLMLEAMAGTAGASGGAATLKGYRSPQSPPFMCVLDEVGYYPVDGLALVAAQARSLGFVMVYSSQDIPAMKRLNEREAASIIANTKTKIFMRSHGCGDEWAHATEGGLWNQLGHPFRKWQSHDDVRPDPSDMDAGEMLVMFKSEKFFAKCLWPEEGWRNPGHFRLRANHFVRMPLVKA